MAPPLVFDTNSLWNFAVVQRLDVVEARYGDRASWTDTIYGEVQNSIGHEPALAALIQCSWLGEPLSLQSSECLKDVARIQRILAAPGDAPTKNLGEAECIHVIEHELQGDAWFVTDDLAAADLARRRRLRVLDTRYVLTDAHSMGELVCPEPYNLLVQMSDAGRGIAVPDSHKDVC